MLDVLDVPHPDERRAGWMWPPENGLVCQMATTGKPVRSSPIFLRDTKPFPLRGTHPLDKGEWGGACPPLNADEELAQGRVNGIEISDELSEKLARLFPPGTDEEKLINHLRMDEYTVHANADCGKSSDVHFALLTDEEEIEDLPEIVDSGVFWKVANGKILWIKGYFYLGPS